MIFHTINRVVEELFKRAKVIIVDMSALFGCGNSCTIKSRLSPVIRCIANNRFQQSRQVVDTVVDVAVAESCAALLALPEAVAEGKDGRATASSAHYS